MRNIFNHVNLYSHMGLPMIPLFTPRSKGLNGKIPAIKAWQNKATVNRDQLNTWFKNPSTQNVGILTGESSGLLVLDIDPRNGGEGSLIEIEKLYGPVPRTPLVHTGGGGYHFYFKTHSAIQSYQNILPGIDVKANGGFIVAPPSLHASGKYYAWDEKLPLDKVPFAPVPEWLIKFIHSKNRISPYHTRIPKSFILSGSRNSSLSELCGYLIYKKVDSILTYKLVHSYNQSYCNPPLKEGEVTSIIDSICRKEQAKRLRS